jgi:glucose-6-phosphate 1-epimerase
MHVQTLMMEGAPAVRLQGPAGDAVTVLLRGAQVISWVDAHGVERLYRSPTSPLDGEQPVRGGVPVIFPQFSGRGPLVRHGFARTRVWEWLPQPDNTRDASLVFRLRHAATETPLWPHDCDCLLTVALTPQGVRMTLAVHNTGSSPLSFHAALHTYLEVGEVTGATLTGVLPQGATLSLAEPIDHLFESVPGPFALRSPAGALDIVHEGFTDAVVWNPGPQAVIGDLPAGGFARFLCVEAASVGVPVQLAPGAHWQGSQWLKVKA